MTSLFRTFLTKPHVLVVTLSVLVFCFLTGHFLMNDFWQDEIYSIEHFIFSSWKTVLTDYHTTNNHIMFNVVVKILLSIIGIFDVKTVLLHPILVRVVPYCFSIFGIMALYKMSSKWYGRSLALTSISVFTTSIVLLDFGTQLRGYSMSVFFTTIQYFSFLHVLKGVRISRAVIFLYLATLFNLLCLPTNIYVTVSYLLYSLICFFTPGFGVYLLNLRSTRKNAVIVLSTIIVATSTALVYYHWLLSLYPPNPLINTFKAFRLKNIVQVLSISYHFTGYRIYFYLILFSWIGVYRTKIFKRASSTVFFPAFLFLSSFILFFLHGPIIIQRTFVSLLPLFCLVVAALFEEGILALRTPPLRILFYFANFICLLISFVVLQRSSGRNNEESIHRQDLVNHYYLINFNAMEATTLSKKVISHIQLPLFVWDDFGKTGIEYYLFRFKVPFHWYNPTVDMRGEMILLTNNKREVEKRLYDSKIPFKRLLNRNEQYCLYLLNTVDSTYFHSVFGNWHGTGRL